MTNTTLSEYLSTHKEWSIKTFGEGRRLNGVLGHIDKELEEIKEDPYDLMEWLDVVILALDGYWRHGGDVERVMDLLVEKQRVNAGRQWPAPSREDTLIERIRYPLNGSE